MFPTTWEQLIEVFKAVGEVVGFRLVFDRDTGKPKGYGFCEFADHETALSAVRNLHSVDVGGRPLRIDLADSDPFLEGKTTVRGELVDGGGPGPSEQWPTVDGGPVDDNFLSTVPSGILLPPGVSAMDDITKTLVAMNASHVMEVLAQMKAYVITHPDQARVLLDTNPQFSYALFQALVIHNIVAPDIIQRMRGGAVHPPPTQPDVQRGLSRQNNPSLSSISSSSSSPYYSPPSSQESAPPLSQPPSPESSPPNSQELSDTQKTMLMTVLSLSPEQINALSDKERAAIEQLRSQFTGVLQQ